MARIATQTHLEKLVAKEEGNEVDPSLGDPHYIKLGPNQIQLYSYYRPGLLAGNYNIFAEQVIHTDSPKHGSQKLRAYNRGISVPYNEAQGTDDITPQEFEVIAPQFSLDPKLINSYYPPDGHQDEARILPHLVINDPHFPWERSPGLAFPDAIDPDVVDKKGGKWFDEDGKVTTDLTKARMRNMVPWVRISQSILHNELPLPEGMNKRGRL
jgi:hypothetical protein